MAFDAKVLSFRSRRVVAWLLIARIQCPILVIQGDVDRRRVAVNKWNNDILFPELRAAGKTLDVKIYPGQMHCFCIDSEPAGRAAAPAS